MAQMPRGEPRSVPDPLGDRVEAAHRQERLKRERAEDAAVSSPHSPGSASFSPSARLLGLRNGSPRLNPTVTIGGQAYREVDNGRANVLVRVDDPLVTPQERAARRQAIDRAFFMADHPIGSVGYMLATLANGSPQARDGALVGGGLLDAATIGAAPRGSMVRSPARPPQRQPEGPALRQEKLRLRELNANGQATGTSAWVTADMLSSGKRPDRRLEPPGWQGDGRKHNEARGHLYAGQLGGPHDDPRNFITLTQNKANTPHMKSFEDMVARKARAGEVIEYSVTPLYGDGVKPPGAILMTAHGSRGAPMAHVVQNPAGRRR